MIENGTSPCSAPTNSWACSVCTRSSMRTTWSAGSGITACAEPAAMIDRDERFLGPDLKLLDRPGVAVRVAEPEERAAVALIEDLDIARLDAALEQLLAGGRRVRDDQLQAPHRARRHLALGRQVTDDDRAARAARRQLGHVHVLAARVVIELEADLVAV